MHLRGDATMSDLYRAVFQGRPPNVKVADGEVTVQYARSSLLDWRKLGAELALNASVPWALEVKGGVSKMQLDEQQFGAIGGIARVQSKDYTPSAGRYDIHVLGRASRLTVESR